MIILLSPSKKQDFKPEHFCSNFTYPKFQDKSDNIINLLKKFSVTDIKNLMNISSNLAELNYNRYQSFNNDQLLKQAILAFKGDVYSYLEFKKYEDKNFKFLQDNFFILSGLYGLLRPLDLIKPHRLEMGTSLKIQHCNNLYEFWHQDITSSINEKLDLNDVIINLASNEYFSAVDTKKIRCPIITISFKELRNDELKTIALNSKRARSMMSNYIILNNILNPEELKNFNENNYKFSSNHSTSNTFVFIK